VNQGKYPLKIKERVMTKQNSNLPAITGMSTAAGAAIAELYAKALGRVGGNRQFEAIQVQHGVKKPKFEIPGHDEQDTLRAVIVNYETIREYRVDKDNTAPTCRSVGGKYGNAFGKCAECKYGQWKDGGNGKNTKDCRDSQILVVVVEGVQGVFEMKVPGSSIKNFGAYERVITKEKGLPFGVIVTEMSLTTESVPGRKPWSVIGFAAKEELAAIKDQDFLANVISGLEKAKGAFIVTTADDVVGTKAVAAAEGDSDDEDAEVIDDTESGVESVQNDTVPF
jgi:hypothetical protein